MPKLFQPELIHLSNGIPVILQNYEGAVAANYWWVKTGSADEQKNEEGFAHFLEHMLFKDTSAKETGKASTGEIARQIESLGGDINAYTSFDQTVYHATCAAHHWEKVLDAWGKMAKPQKFLKSDFEREREVILEELKKNEDSPGRQLFQNLFSLTFKKHPYGRPVIGYAKTLKAAKVGNLESFYNRSYVSDRMGLILVGPLEDAKGARKKQILKVLEKRFGQSVIKNRASPRPARPTETPLREAPALATKSFDVKTPTLGISFRVPELSSPDMPALDLMSGILGMGELSRLYQQLFYKTSLVTDISAGLYCPSDPGMFHFHAEVDAIDKVLPAAEAIFKEIKKLIEEGPTAEELSRVMVNSESERLYSTQTVDGTASRLGFLQFILGDLDFDQKYLEDLRAQDAASIKEVAIQYFDPKRMSVSVLVPKDKKDYDTAPIAALAQKILPSVSSSPSMKKLKSAHPKKSEPVEFITLPSGIRLIRFDRPQSHAFSVYATALGGIRSEISDPIENAEKDWGASHLMALSWTKGAGALDARAISSITEGSAAGMDGFSGRSTLGLQLTGLSKDFGKLSELFTQVLLTPTFPEEELGHAKRVVVESLRSLEDHSSQLCSRLFLESLFEKHAYGKIIYGSEASLKALNSERLKAFHRKWLKPENLVISVSGNVKKSGFESWVVELEKQALKILGNSPAQPLPKIGDEPALKGPRWAEKSLKREQTHIIVGGLGTRINESDRHAIRLMQTILAGQSGRLFIELREKKSLAYTVSPMNFEGIERGYIGTYIACSPQKKEEALAGIKTVLEVLAERGPSPSEMKRAKEFSLGRRAMDLQSDSAIAGHYGLEAVYKMPHLTDAEIVKRIEGITGREVQNACRKYLVEPFMVTSVVG